MSGDLFSNKSQIARDSYEDVLRKIADNLSPDAGGTNFTFANNVTIKGTLTVSGLISGTNQAYTSIASIAAANIYALASTQTALVVTNAVLQGPTIAPLQIIASTASSAFFSFQGAVISTASINLAANKVAGVIQVTYSGVAGQGIGYLPIFQGVV